MSRSSCETCGCSLEPVHGDHVGHEERSGDDACINYLKAKADTLRTAGDALCVLAASYAGDTGLHENGHLWGAIEEWERVAAVATK